MSSESYLETENDKLEKQYIENSVIPPEMAAEKLEDYKINARKRNSSRRVYRSDFKMR